MDEEKQTTAEPAPIDDGRSPLASMTRIKYEDVDRKAGFPVTITIFGASAATDTNYGRFFTAPRPCEVMWAAEVHRTKSTQAGSALQMEILDPGTQKGSGRDVFRTAWSFETADNTPVMKSGSDITENCTLTEGQSLGLWTAVGLTSLTNCQVTVYLKWLNRGDFF